MKVGRRFKLLRETDPNGASGTGIVATGIEFPDGQAVYRWKSDPATTQVAESIEVVETLHGHGGSTQVKWVD